MSKQTLAAKPSLEQISPAFGSSFLVRRYANSCENELANWHFHPELELVYVNGGSGKRHIGKHMSYFNDGELILMGANLPHYGFTDRHSGNKSETVIQFKQDFLGTNFFDIPEMGLVKRLLELSKKGLPDEIAALCEKIDSTEADREIASYLLDSDRSMVLMGNMARIVVYC